MTASLPYARGGDGVRLRVRLVPKAASCRLIGVVDDGAGGSAVKLAVNAAPERGAANEAMLRIPGRRAAPAEDRARHRRRREGAAQARADFRRPGADRGGAFAMARLIDGKAHAAALRAAVAAAAAHLKPRGIVPGLAAVLVGDDPASEVYVRSKGKASEEAGLASFAASPAGHDERIRASGAGRRAQRRSRRGRHPGAAAAAEADRSAARHRRARPGQGCGRLPPAQCRAAVERRRGARAVHALWLPAFCCARRVGSLAGAEAVVVGRSNIVGKPMAALLLGRALHGDARPFADARSAVRRAPRRHPGRRRGQGRDGARVVGEAGRHGDRCRHQPRRRRGRQAAASSATWLSPRRPKSRARSRRCRAASAR